MTTAYNAIYRNDTQLYSFLENAERLDINCAWTGAFTQTLPIQIYKIEDMVFLRLNSFANQSVTATSVLTSSAGTLPVGYRPIGDCVVYGTGNIAGNIILWQFRANNAGTIQISTCTVSGANLLVGQQFSNGTLINQPQDVYLTYKAV